MEGGQRGDTLTHGLESPAKLCHSSERCAKSVCVTFMPTARGTRGLNAPVSWLQQEARGLESTNSCATWHSLGTAGACGYFWRLRA